MVGLDPTIHANRFCTKGETKKTMANTMIGAMTAVRCQIVQPSVSGSTM
ncbi:hypothetical protein J2Y63_003237 [Shinella sp. BE166]